MSSASVPDVSPDVPPLKWRVVLGAIGKLPERGLSRLFGRIADTPIPPSLRPPVLGAFAKAVGIDVSEAELPLSQYATLNRFFVRRLRPGARHWPDDPAVLASPVDGIVGRLGGIRAGTALQAKGHPYSVAELLGDAELAGSFEAGSYLTIYLSPRHYHRIHTPAAGDLIAATYIPGELYPVNGPAVMHIPRLFARNERLVCDLQTAMGRVALVAVGAYNVGRISAAFEPEWGESGWVTNRPAASMERRRYSPPIRIATADELMAFHLGSTIVLLTPPGSRLDSALEPGAPIRLGARISR